MRLRYNPAADSQLAACPLVIAPVKGDFFQWQKIFNNNHPIVLELGAGKGDFAIAYALKNREVNLVAIERSPTVAAVMAKKAMQVKELANLRIIVGNVSDLQDWFGPRSVSAIFLNFSDPWPKKRHASRRLTHIFFVNKYKAVCVPGALVTLRTDNTGLYEFTLEHLQENGISAEYNSVDLYRGKLPEPDAVISEYERKFCAAGTPIKMVTFRV